MAKRGRGKAAKARRSACLHYLIDSSGRIVGRGAKRKGDLASRAKKLRARGEHVRIEKVCGARPRAAALRGLAGGGSSGPKDRRLCEASGCQHPKVNELWCREHAKYYGKVQPEHGGRYGDDDGPDSFYDVEDTAAPRRGPRVDFERDVDGLSGPPAARRGDTWQDHERRAQKMTDEELFRLTETSIGDDYASGRVAARHELLAQEMLARQGARPPLVNPRRQPVYGPPWVPGPQGDDEYTPAQAARLRAGMRLEGGPRDRDIRDEVDGYAAGKAEREENGGWTPEFADQYLTAIDARHADPERETAYGRGHNRAIRERADGLAGAIERYRANGRRKRRGAIARVIP